MTESPHRRVAAGPGPDAFRGATRVERALLPFLREPTLWPVLAVLVAHAVVLVAPMLVLAWRDPRGWSSLGLAVLGLPSVVAVGRELRDHGRPRLLSALIAGTWALCGVAAWGAVWLGWL